MFCKEIVGFLGVASFLTASPTAPSNPNEWRTQFLDQRFQNRANSC